MNKLFRVVLSVTTLVEAESSDAAEALARQESSDIIGDGDVEVEAAETIQTLEELHAVNRGWSASDIAYGAENKLGTYFDELEAHHGNKLTRCSKTVDMFGSAEPESPPNWIELVARKKIGSDDWGVCIWHACAGGDSLVEGAIPNIGLDGSRRWVGIELRKVVVTAAEIDAAKLAYEAETGKCSNCAGTGQEHAGWHYQTGIKYRPCMCCAATGKAVTP